MAQKGRGKKIRFQGGTLFPTVLAVVTVLGLALIWYSRASIDSKAPGPRASNGDHWHVAYGFYACDATDGAAGYLGNLTGNIETSSKYAATGVHSHDDGVIHWHPFTAAASGRNAKLKVFLDNYDISLSDDKLEFPEGQFGGKVYEEGTTKCKDADGDEVDGVLKLFVWPDSSNPSDFRLLTSNMDDLHITDNGMAVALAFVPADVESVPEPPTAAQLPELGAVDSGQVATTVPADGSDTTVAGEDLTGSTTVPASGSDTTVASETTVAVTDTTAAG